MLLPFQLRFAMADSKNSASHSSAAATSAGQPVSAGNAADGRPHGQESRDSPGNLRDVLPLLQAGAQAGRSMSDELLCNVAAKTGVPESKVAGVASFYSMLPRATERGVPIRLCDGPVCQLHGAAAVEQSLRAAAAGDAKYRICRTSCIGLCDRGPAALVGDMAAGPVDADRFDALVADCPQRAPDYATPLPGERRVALARLGRVAGPCYETARRAGAYRSLQQAQHQGPQAVLEEIEHAELRGCGGAGYLTAAKWRATSETQSAMKYVIANADESEPGAFKDRVLLEGDPHLLLEGMALAALAVGASRGIIYVRGEYEQSARCLETAIDQARAAGWLGHGATRSTFDFDVDVHRGAGAYICGEETAMLESIEGRRGEPRLRPPYPTSQGLFGFPTVVNNVETLCMAPAIVQHGGSWFRSLGINNAAGAKIFTLTGHTRREAAFEAPLGVTVRTLIELCGLGMRSGSQFKMALTGGAAGTFIPAALLDTPLDFSSANDGVALGSGVVIVFDASVSAVDALEWVLRFFRYESCGKCTPCREGVAAAHRLVRRVAQGDGQKGDLDALQRLASMVETASLCGLGKSIALPIDSALKWFAADFHALGAC